MIPEAIGKYLKPMPADGIQVTPAVGVQITTVKKRLCDSGMYIHVYSYLDAIYRSRL